MTTDEFLENVATYDRPSDTISKALQALWYAHKGDQWEKAHCIAQDAHSIEGNWVHAHLHRQEGDLGNADYWYRLAKQPSCDLPIDEERISIITELVSREA